MPYRYLIALALCLQALAALQAPAQSCGEAEQPPATCPLGLGEGFTVIKRFALPAGSSAQEFTYILSQGTEYMFTLCGPEGQGPPEQLTVLDSYRNMLFSNYDKRAQKYHQRMGYACAQTGVVTFKLAPAKGTRPGCHWMVVSFRPN